MRLLVVAATLGTAVLGSCSRPPEGRTRKALTVTGIVLERVDGPPYSYLRIKTEEGELWAMVPTTRVGKDQPVTIVDGVLLRDFDTGVPSRRFDVVMGALQVR